jgi:hypothetical protein
MITNRPFAESVESAVAEALARFKAPISPEDIFKAIALNHLPAEFREEAEGKAAAQLKEVYDLIDEASKKETPEARRMTERILEMSLESDAAGWVYRRMMRRYDNSRRQILFNSKSIKVWIERNRVGIPAMALMGTTEMAAVATQAMNL